jgi:hypothetical protein
MKIHATARIKLTRSQERGTILDASLRHGFYMSKAVDTFINAQYIRGGARGTDENDPGPGDGYTNNLLHTAAISLGVYVH